MTSKTRALPLGPWRRLKLMEALRAAFRKLPKDKRASADDYGLDKVLDRIDSYVDLRLLPLRAGYDSEDLEFWSDKLSNYVIGEMDRDAADAFICCPTKYREQVRTTLEEDDAYIEVPQDFRSLISDSDERRGELPFFLLEKNMKHKCGVPLRTSMRNHKWGYFSLILKRKHFLRVRSGEYKHWSDVKWRCLVSMKANRYKPVYSVFGRFLSYASTKYYGRGYATTSPAEVHSAVEQFNSRIRAEAGALGAEAGRVY